MLIDNNFDIQQTLQPELLPNEKLLWTGRPKTGFVFRSSDVFFIPFSILWFGFAIFWESGASAGGTFFMIWGIPFILMGFYMTIGRFFYDRMFRDKAIYGITTNRIIIRSGVFKIATDSFNIATLDNLSLEEKRDGSGNIKLAQNNYPFSGFAIRGWPGNKEAPQLELIPDVRNVYNLILQQQHKSV